MTDAFHGVIIEESLRHRGCLRILRIQHTRVVDIAQPAPGQPDSWTVTDFEIDNSDASTLATSLSHCLIAGPWYVDFNNGEKTYVVFAGRIFSYERGDAAGLEEARVFARSVGVPEAQIDWAVPD